MLEADLASSLPIFFFLLVYQSPQSLRSNRNPKSQKQQNPIISFSEKLHASIFYFFLKKKIQLSHLFSHFYATPLVFPENCFLGILLSTFLLLLFIKGVNLRLLQSKITMERHVLLSLLLLSLIVFDASDAFFVREHRKLANLDPENGKKSSTQVSTVSNQQNTDPNLVGRTKKKKKDESPSTNDNNTQEKGITGSNNSSNSNKSSSPAPAPLKDSNVPQKEAAPPAENSGGGGNENVGSKGGKENKENEMKIVSQSTTTETCDEKKKQCKDNGPMVGCISKIDPTYVVVLLHNGGNEAIKVKLIEGNLEDIEVGDQTKEVNISLTTSEGTQLKFNAGKGDCVLYMGTLVPKWDSFVRLPSYDQILTPVNGAYFLILTVLLFGGTWACCKCRKKRHDEVPYQELEMAMPESVSATNVESAEGWDQGWDDDWDDDAAVKSPATRHAGSISANGLTARSSNKDGWENNWDD